MDLQEFIGEILGESHDKSTVTVYRGHPDKTYTLKPAVFRSREYIENEHLLLRDLVAVHPEEFAADESALEMLVRMQHYSLPTRLLDATWNPLVALYFAATRKRKRVVNQSGRTKTTTVQADGEVVRFIVDKKLVKYFDSDTVSCLANLARCDYEQKRKISSIVSQIVKEDKYTITNNFNDYIPVKRLLHFIRMEKPAFESEIIPSDLSTVPLVKPKQSNRRILAQEGCFFLFGLIEEIDERGVPGIQIERIGIPADNKKKIINQLNRIAINERTLFPEIERAAKYLTQDIQKILSRSV
jgi:hypothetical protein